jgi:SulP family sulfate permease
MFVVSYDLVDVPRIRRVVRSSKSDAVAFVATLIGTWVLTLDAAIYLGVGISLVLFLRRARLLRVVELAVGPDGALQERSPGAKEALGTCPKVRLLQVEGSLFFGAAGELQSAVIDATRSPSVQVVLVRVKRAHGLDATTAAILADTAALLRAKDRHLVLCGMTPEVMAVLERSGAAEVIGPDNLFPTRQLWFSALAAATRRAVELSEHDDEDCPLHRLDARASVSLR